MKKPRVLVADDHQIFLDGLKRILEPTCHVVGSVRNGRDVLDAVKRMRPDVLVVDISMPEMNGIEAVRRLRKFNKNTRTVFLTMHRDVAYAAEAFRAGASGYVLKDSESEELTSAIREVAAGRYYLTPSIAKESLGELLQHGSKSAPSPRQREVLQLLAEGYKLKEIAHRLNISISTAEFHKTALMRRLGAGTTAELLRFAMSKGLIPA
jgi:DNA-binding NarL/FixJ family response regulator